MYRESLLEMCSVVGSSKHISTRGQWTDTGTDQTRRGVRRGIWNKGCFPSELWGGVLVTMVRVRRCQVLIAAAQWVACLQSPSKSLLYWPIPQGNIEERKQVDYWLFHPIRAEYCAQLTLWLDEKVNSLLCLDFFLIKCALWSECSRRWEKTILWILGTPILL